MTQQTINPDSVTWGYLKPRNAPPQPTVSFGQIEMLQRSADWVLACIAFGAERLVLPDIEVTLIPAVLMASTRESFRKAKREHNRELNREQSGNKAVCNNPKKCRVCSGNGISEAGLKRERKREQKGEPVRIQRTSDAHAPTCGNGASSLRSEEEMKETSDKSLSKKPEKRPVSSPPKLKAKSPNEISFEIEIARGKIGEPNSRLVDELCSLLAEENKSGKVQLSRLLRELWQPLADSTTKFSTEELRYGLEVAVKNGIPNANYAKKAAASYEPTRSTRTSRTLERFTPQASPANEYDDGIVWVDTSPAA
jgi:hypothetical protein